MTIFILFVSIIEERYRMGTRQVHSLSVQKSHSLSFWCRIPLYILLVNSIPRAQSVELIYHINEEIEIGTPIGNLGQDSNISRLLSQQEFNSLVFEFLPFPVDAKKLLTLDPHLGVVRSADRIDRETLCPYVTRCILPLHVSARTKSGQHYYTFDVKVFVEDINDNSPTFDPDSLAVLLDEDVARFSSIPISRAVDEDIGPNGLQSYDLETPSDEFGLKVTRNLDNSLVPQLYVKSPLNRETQAFYQLYVLAQDGGRPQLSGKLLVNVTLRDVNDNSPRFLQTRYTVNVTETTPKGSSILQLEAEDIDIGDNGKVTYRLGLRQSEEIFSVFRISPNTGHVITLQDLTSYQDRKFTLIVEAVDGGGKSAQAELVVHVIDSINDAPHIRITFPADSKVNVVDEDVRRGFVVGHFIAEDSDTGQNGEVRCFLDRSTRAGALAAETFGLQRLRNYEYKVTVFRPLDRETRGSYHVTITCRDSGRPPLRANEMFSVVLRDVNDFAPEFTLPVWAVKIAENSVNENVVRLEATDRDLGVNKVIRYGLGNVTSLVSTYIKVNQETGLVTTRKPLDRELFDTLDFQVVATDTGDPPMTSTARVLITVLDQNDNYPRVPLGYSLTVPENSPSWTVVGQIEAIDPDLGSAGEVIYQLMSDNEATKLFNLTQDGLLRTLRSFDREHRDLYDLNVLASDSAPTNPRTNMLHIRVQIADVNDHKPEFRFPRPGNATIMTSSDAPVNATLGYLSARDPDSGDNGTLHYTVLDDGGLDILRVDHAMGRIYTSRNLRVRDVGDHVVRVFVRDLGVPPLTSTDILMLVIQLGNTSLAAQSHHSGMGRREHIIIVGVLVSVTLSIALCVLLVFLRVFRRDGRNGRHKYSNGSPAQPSGDSGALGGASRCQGDAVGSALKGDTWRQYNTPAGVTYDMDDDVIMFKLKLAEQYRELEPEDKDPLMDKGLGSNSVLSDTGGVRSTIETQQGSAVTVTMASFQSGATHSQPVASIDTKLSDKKGNIPTSGLFGDDGKPTSQEKVSLRDDKTLVDADGYSSLGTYTRGDNVSKRRKIAGFEKAPVLKTFQSCGIVKSSSHRDDMPEGTTTDHSQKFGQHIPKTDSSVTSLKQVTSTPSSPAASERTTGPSGFSDTLRTSDLYQKRVAKSDKPTGLDDTILKRLVINGRKLTEDDGYCSSAPSGESMRDASFDGVSSVPLSINKVEFDYPPPPSSASPSRDMRLCSEPPVSPYTKMSSLPPFTYHEISTVPRPADPKTSCNSLTRHLDYVQSGKTASTFGGGSIWHQRPPLLAGRHSPLSVSKTVSPSWHSPYSTVTSSSPSPSLSLTDNLTLRNAPTYRDILNDSIETQEDGNTTTTSGSYVIDDDELSVDLPPANVYV